MESVEIAVRKDESLELYITCSNHILFQMGRPYGGESSFIPSFSLNCGTHTVLVKGVKNHVQTLAGIVNACRYSGFPYHLEFPTDRFVSDMAGGLQFQLALPLSEEEVVALHGSVLKELQRMMAPV